MKHTVWLGLALVLMGCTQPSGATTAQAGLDQGNTIGLSQDTVVAMARSETPTQQSPKGHPITSLFVRDNLNTTVAYLEQNIGAARRVYGDTREYLIQGCTLQVGAKEGNIVSLTVDLSAKCPINWADLSGENTSLTHEVTFQDIEKMLGEGFYQADCLTMCGNAFDPSIYLTIPGYRANGFMDIQVSSVQYSYETSSAWADQIKKQKGEDYLIDTGFNCDQGLFDPVIRPLISTTKIDRITIGEVAQLCEG